MELNKKEPKIKVDKMTIEQLDDLSAQIGQKIGKIMDDANLQCNKILNIYGMQTQIGYNIVKLEEKTKKDKKQKKSRKL